MVGVGESALLLEKEDKKESGPGSGKKRSNKNQQNLSGTNNEPRPKNQAEESKKYCIYHALGIVHRISSREIRLSSFLDFREQASATYIAGFVVSTKSLVRALGTYR